MILIAILGGDGREWELAVLLAEAGYAVKTYGVPEHADHPKVEVCVSAVEAVHGAQWIICPSPGLAAGDVVYAPAAADPITLDRQLINVADLGSGGLILGRATQTVEALVVERGGMVAELKSDVRLGWRNATSTSEAMLRVLIENTDAVLDEVDVRLIGSGKTAWSFASRLLAIGGSVTVAARNESEQARMREGGAGTVAFGERLDALTPTTVIVNTVPDTSAIPPSAFADLVGRTVIDIASPPGGLDHGKAEEAGVHVIWARGLAGGRAPATAGRAHFEFCQSVITRSEIQP